MPCAIRNLSSYPLPGKHVPQVVIEINGEKDGGKRTFSTLDLVEGTAVVTVTQETYLGHVDITFEGTLMAVLFHDLKLNHRLTASRYLYNIRQSGSFICARPEKGFTQVPSPQTTNRQLSGNTSSTWAIVQVPLLF